MYVYIGLSAVGPWQEPMVDVVVRDHAVNDSALPQFETMQMRYRVTPCVGHHTSTTILT